MKIKAIIIIAAISLTFAMLPAKEATRSAIGEDATYHISKIGPYVELGSYRIWVNGKLGQPDIRIGSDFWVYDVKAPKSVAFDPGTDWKAVVCFNDKGRVEDLIIVSSPAGSAFDATQIAGMRKVQPEANLAVAEARK